MLMNYITANVSRHWNVTNCKLEYYVPINFFKIILNIPVSAAMIFSELILTL